MSSDRVDLFSLIHKGVRGVLFETAMELSRTDFAAPDEREHAEAAIRRCFGYLREHADHEDREIQPWITRFSPAVAAVLAAEHVTLEKASIAVESLLPRLAAAAPDERLAMGAELQRRFYLLVSDQLRHLNREEREANAVMWSNLLDPALLEIGGRITTQIAPARLAEWCQLVGSVANRRERDALGGATATR
jgi:hypothetical protein